uniref:Uncharacterized protein n=1 Tax=Ciona savignyi TaxID=51511 RepID=H2YL33_CIOSA
MATIQMEIAEDNPDKWVEVLNNCLNLKEGEEKNKLLKEFFSKASNYLTEEKHSNSENYAKILAEEAIFIGSADVIAGQTKFKKAADICRNVPFIHLSYAQYEVRNGNLDNALKVLQFGKTATGCYIFDQPIAKLKIDISARKSNASAPLKNRTNTDTPQKTETKKEMILKTPTLLRNRFKPLDSIYCDIKTPSPPKLSFSVTKTFPDHFKFDLPSLSNSKPSTNHVAASASKSKGK